jgi:hypothetical protein
MSLMSLMRASFVLGASAFLLATFTASPSLAQHHDEHATTAGGAVPEHAGHESDHDHPGAVNWTDFAKPHQPPFIAVVINAALLFGLYYWKGKKPIAEGLKNRRIALAQGLPGEAQQT